MGANEKITSFKLVTGEEIIGKVTSDVGGRIVIERPRLVRMIPSNGAVGIALLPWVVSAGDEGAVTIFEKSIVTVVEPLKELQDTYLAETSGLELASPSSFLRG